MNTAAANKLILLICIPVLFGCSRQTTHIPPLWQLPVALIGNSINNTIYSAKRDEVKKYVVENYDSLARDIQKKNGVYLEEILRRIRVDKHNAPAIKESLHNDYQMMFDNTDIIKESLMNVYASLYVARSDSRTKTMNGFSYTNAASIIHQYIAHDFTRFRMAAKENDTTYLKPLLDALKIQDTKNKTIFLETLFTHYDDYFIEPVVVGIMVHT